MHDISVIIPTWNRKPFLKKAIQSVLNQSLAPLEIFVSDDGSTDDSYRMVQSFHNPKIKWISAPHTGLPAVVRNRAIKQSRGEWIAFLDSDDEWHPKKLEHQLTFIKKKDCLAVCSNAYSVNNAGGIKKYLAYENDTITFSDILTVNYVILSSAIIHRSLLYTCNGFPESPDLKTGPDYAFWLRILTQTKFAYLDELLVNYFDDPSMTIRKYTKNPRFQKKIILRDFLVWSRRNNISLQYQVEAIKHYIRLSVIIVTRQILKKDE